jgi:hypothetical protein
MSELGDYRCPTETYRLLQKWGRSLYTGMPNLSYPRKATGVGDYLSKRVRDDVPLPNLSEFDRVCWLIDHTISRPKQEALKCKFRHQVRGRPMNKRESATHMGINLSEYDLLLRSAIRSIDLNLNGDDVEIV